MPKRFLSCIWMYLGASTLRVSHPLALSICRRKRKRQNLLSFKTRGHGVAAMKPSRQVAIVFSQRVFFDTCFSVFCFIFYFLEGRQRSELREWIPCLFDGVVFMWVCGARWRNQSCNDGRALKRKGVVVAGRGVWMRVVICWGSHTGSGGRGGPIVHKTHSNEHVIENWVPPCVFANKNALDKFADRDLSVCRVARLHTRKKAGKIIAAARITSKPLNQKWRKVHFLLTSQ